MALEKLKILVELPGGKLQFNEHAEGGCIVAMFNPSRLILSTTVSWKSQKAAKRNTPEHQFVGTEMSPVTLELFFDTYDSPLPADKKQDVRDCTSKLFDLTKVQSEKHRPPICRLAWGAKGVFFQGVLQQLERQYTMFMENGTPVRATVKCTFMRWRTNKEDLEIQNLMSADVAKLWVVKSGDTLPAIAAHEYCDTRKWRAIADANGIDNPLALQIGGTLVLPALHTSAPIDARREIES